MRVEGTNGVPRPAAGAAGGWTDAPDAPPTDLRWQRSYDRASVDRFTAEVAEQRRRLHAQVDAAREEVRRSRAAAAERAEAQAALAGRVRAVQRELEQAEREHLARLASISGDAADAAARLVSSALDYVEALHAATSIAAK